MRVLSDYRDVYSYFDSGISVYNFLQFSTDEWRRYNPDLNYQNRLRHCDFRAIFTAAGFEILDDQPAYDRATAERVLGRMRLAEEFKQYSFEELAPVRGVLLVRKAATSEGLGHLRDRFDAGRAQQNQEIPR